MGSRLTGRQITREENYKKHNYLRGTVRRAMPSVIQRPVACGNSVSILHRLDSTTFTMYVAVSDLEKSFSFDDI